MRLSITEILKKKIIIPIFFSLQKKKIRLSDYFSLRLKTEIKNISFSHKKKKKRKRMTIEISRQNFEDY